MFDVFLSGGEQGVGEEDLLGGGVRKTDDTPVFREISDSVEKGGSKTIQHLP